MATHRRDNSGDDSFQKRGGQVKDPKAPKPPQPVNERPKPPSQPKK